MFVLLKWLITGYKPINTSAMEEFIKKYSKWFPYCEKSKLIEEMSNDLRALAEPSNEQSNCNIPHVSNSLCECDDFKNYPVQWICTNCNKEWIPPKTQ